MAATSKTEQINALLTTTSKNYYKASLVQDNIFQSNPLYACLHGKEDGIRKEDVGGDEIKINVMYEDNGNFGWYRDYDLLDDTPQDGMTAGYARWSQASVANVISGIQKYQNSGPSKLVSLWKEKYKQSMYTAEEESNKSFLDVANITVATETTASSGKAINGLPLLIQVDPTAAGTLHGINQANEAWWRNRTVDFGATDTTQALYAKMLSLYNDCGKAGGGNPDIGVTDQITYENYVQHLDKKVRYTTQDTTGSKVGPGFEGVMFLGAKLFWDVYMPDMANATNGADGTTLTEGSLFWINSKFMSLCVGKGFDFAPQGVKTAERQDAVREYLLFYGQLVTNNRRKHGVLHGIEPVLTITAP